MIRAFPYGSREQVECVSTQDLKAGDTIWYGQGWATVLDTKQEGGCEDQCVVLWRELDDPGSYRNDGYTAFGNVVLRVRHD